MTWDNKELKPVIKQTQKNMIKVEMHGLIL